MTGTNFVPTGLERARREHLVEVVRQVERIATETGSDLTPAQLRRLVEPVTIMVAEIAVLDGAFALDDAGFQGYVAGIARTLGISRDEALKAWQAHGRRIVDEAAVSHSDWLTRVRHECKGRANPEVSRPHFSTWANVYTTLKDWRDLGILTAARLIRVFGREACVEGRVRIGAGIAFERRSVSGTWMDVRILEHAKDLSAAYEYGEAAAGKVFESSLARARKILH